MNFTCCDNAVDLSALALGVCGQKSVEFPTQQQGYIVHLAKVLHRLAHVDVRRQVRRIDFVSTTNGPFDCPSHVQPCNYNYGYRVGDVVRGDLMTATGKSFFARAYRNQGPL